jgi:hypothetical protein
MKPQEGMVCPSAPLSRGPDGLEFWLQGKISPVLAGKCIAMAVVCAELAAEPKMVRRQTSFPTKHRVEHTCEPYWRSNCEICTCLCQGSEMNGNLIGGWATFGADITAPFVTSPPGVGSRAPTSLSRGGRDGRVMATLSIPRGIHGLHHGCGCRVVASSYCFTHGRGKANKKHGQKKFVVQRNTRWKMLF